MAKTDIRAENEAMRLVLIEVLHRLFDDDQSPRKLAASINEAVRETIREKTANATPALNDYWTDVLNKAEKIILSASGP
jgi:hypothetical protein